MRNSPEYMKQWRYKNREKTKAYNAKYYKAHSGEVNARTRAWFAAHPERGAAIRKRANAVQRAKDKAKLARLRELEQAIAEGRLVWVQA